MQPSSTRTVRFKNRVLQITLAQQFCKNNDSRQPRPQIHRFSSLCGCKPPQPKNYLTNFPRAPQRAFPEARELHLESWGKCILKHEERQTAKYAPKSPISFASTPFNHSAWRIPSNAFSKLHSGQIPPFGSERYLRNKEGALPLTAFKRVICGLSPRHLRSLPLSFVVFNRAICGL